MDDSQLLFKMAYGHGVVDQGTRGWAIRVRASGEGGQNKFMDQNSVVGKTTRLIEKGKVGKPVN